jgi:hypothetical protein
MQVESEVCDKLSEKCAYDGSVLVRTELASAIQWFIIDFQTRFASLCAELDRKAAEPTTSGTGHHGGGSYTVFLCKKNR